jgi:hypothetical protein
MTIVVIKGKVDVPHLSPILATTAAGANNGLEIRRNSIYSGLP